MKSTINRILIIVIGLAALMQSCTEEGHWSECLQQIDALLYENPDSAYLLLCKMENDTEIRKTKAEKMRWSLLSVDAYNKLNMPMPTDTAFREIVEYYDSHGNANERMRAHYLMGCIYRNTKEALNALKCYQEAISCADTLSEDCDYKVLFRIYGQMSDIYRKQFLYEESINAFYLSSKYAEKAGDIYNQIWSLDLMIGAYYAIDDTAKVFELTEKVRKLYEKHGYHEEASGVLDTEIWLYIRMKQYDKARKLMNRFENESGMFDEKGNIQSGAETYYYAQAQYYNGIGQTDSAKICCRKLLKSDYQYHYYAYAGLMNVYATEEKGDSLAEYTTLLIESFDSLLSYMQSEALMQATSMYNYTKSQKALEQSRMEKEDAEQTVILIIIIGVAVFVFAFLRYRKYRRDRQCMIDELSYNYWNAVEKMEATRNDLASVKAAYKSYKAEKINEITRLENELSRLTEDKHTNLIVYEKLKADYNMQSAQMDELRLSSERMIRKTQEELDALSAQVKEYRKKYNQFKLQDKEKPMLLNELMEYFRELTKPAFQESSVPSEKKWNKVLITIQNEFPTFYDTIMKGDLLSRQEMRTCILAYLGFQNGEIAVILGTSPQRITNAKASANRKLFGAENAIELVRNLKNAECVD